MYRFLCASFLFFILGLRSGNAQERFEGWISDDQFILSKTEGEKNQNYLVTLPGGKKVKTDKNVETDGNRFRRQTVLPNGDEILFQDKDLFLFKANGEKMQLTNDPGEERNVRVAGVRNRIAYTKDHDLYVYDLNTSVEKRLTYDGSESLYNGWASWVYYEEILGRSSRYAAFWWSPDGEKIAFLRTDDSPVPKFTLFRSEGQRGDLEVNHYPKPGDPNPDVQFAIVDVESAKVLMVDEDREKDQYSALPYWTPDSKYLLIQEVNRGQDTLHIVRVDPTTGERKTIYEEIQKSWVDFFDELHFLNESEFIVKSNRDGWYNYYRCDLEGNLKNITPVSWRVMDIVQYDDVNERIFFYGTGGVNTDRHLFSVQTDGGAFMQHTKAPGWHNVDISAKAKFFYDQYSTLDAVGQRQIVDKNGMVVFALEHDSVNENEISGVKVEPLSITTEDGFTLPGYWVLPKGFSESKTYPVVFTIYGGPNSEGVRNRYRNFSGDFFSNNDIIRVVVDHRASGKFGKRGLDYMHRNLGKWEIDDLVSAVKWLRTKPFIDSTRVGITGGSYGGYVTCMALTYGADYFTHGISLYPVTDWLLYDNVYTERFMDTPTDNPDGYEFGSAMTHAHKFKGKLLIVHGLMDDNVHMQNTMQFVSKMQDLGKEFEMMVYPGERHGWGGAKRSHLTKLTNRFWKKHFNPGSSGRS